MANTNCIPPDVELFLDMVPEDLLMELEDFSALNETDADESPGITPAAAGPASEETPAGIPEETPSQPADPENDIVFDVRFRGYDRQQVEKYIDALTRDYNRICARCRDLEERNEVLREGTHTIGSAILKAEKCASRIVMDAETEARRIRQCADPLPFPSQRLYQQH